MAKKKLISDLKPGQTFRFPRKKRVYKLQQFKNGQAIYTSMADGSEYKTGWDHDIIIWP